MTMISILLISAVGLSWATLSSAALLVPVSVTTSSDFAVGEDAPNLIDPTDFNVSGGHVGQSFGGGASWLSTEGTTGEQWAFVDLGGLYRIHDLLIWNYHSLSAGAGDVSGRSVDAFEMFVGTPSAVLPTVPNSSAFGTGWTSAAFANFVRGPNSDPGAASYVLDPGNEIGLVTERVQYVGIQIGSRYGTDPYTTTAVGLGHIQVNVNASLPEPSSAVLVGLGAILLGYSRRKFQV